MRRYADPVEVRQGRLDDVSSGVPGGDAGPEGPEQFLWRGRLWKVRAVLAHWVETGPWWHAHSARAALGTEAVDGAVEQQSGRTPLGDLVTERELWRVEAGRGRPGPSGEADPDTSGVFDLAFDWAEGRWTLVVCAD